jgi:hypothetical protein
MDWDNIFKDVIDGESLDKATATLHDNVNSVMNKMAPWITVQCDPNHIGPWATDDPIEETNKKNNEHLKPTIKGKNGQSKEERKKRSQ